MDDISPATCQAPLQLTATTGAVLLSRLVTANCGTSSRPLTLHAQPGQTLNISLYDFSASGAAGQQSRCSDVYGDVTDLSSADTTVAAALCSGSERKRQVLSSSGHAVQITLSQDRLGSLNAILIYDGRCIQETHGRSTKRHCYIHVRS